MSRRKDTHAPGVKTKEKIPVAKTKVAKKNPKPNQPKRPLSAYNYFFRDQRASILVAIREKDKEAAKTLKAPKKSDNVTEYKVELDDDTIARLKKADGKISFQEVGKLIGKHWKSGIDPQRLARYDEMAKMDARRYRTEMIEFDRRDVARISNVASVSSAPRANENLQVPTTAATAATATRASAFSSVVPPLSYPPYGGMSSFLASQQGMLPSNYGQYGMGIGQQGTIGAAAMLSGRYGNAAASLPALSNVYGLQMGGGQGYSSSNFVTPQTMSTRGGSLEGRHWGRANLNPSQSLAGVSLEGNTIDWMRSNYSLSLDALRGSAGGIRPIQVSSTNQAAANAVQGGAVEEVNHPGAPRFTSKQSSEDEQKSL